MKYAAAAATEQNKERTKTNKTNQKNKQTHINKQQGNEEEPLDL